ncbi:LCP family glycopolymer transferase [Corticicoccus populi]|uniref:LCP family protein n=1 Tax=Corticicoccus populi TaxID=1812821 RepID=A0ABW5WXV9_9STAP
MRNSEKRGRSTAFKVLITIFLVLLLVFVGLAVYVYLQLKGTADSMYDDDFEDSQSQLRDTDVQINEGDPISVVLFGTDDDEARNEVQMGQRSDTMMVVTLNPNTGEGKMVSIPRDTRAEIVDQGTVEKINHAYAYGGPVGAKNTVENFLDVPIDYFVSINMDGFETIVDELGGVTVTSNDTFEQSGYTFNHGQTYEMDGEEALAFARARKGVGSGGDGGRQQRQQLLVQAIAKEMISLQTVTNFNSILDVLGDNIRTNIQFNEMNTLRSEYQDAATNIDRLLLEGYDERSAEDNLYYFYPDDASYEEVKSELQNNLEIAE